MWCCIFGSIFGNLTLVSSALQLLALLATPQSRPKYITLFLVRFHEREAVTNKTKLSPGPITHLCTQIPEHHYIRPSQSAQHNGEHTGHVLNWDISEEILH
jgi:hypothetical protein